MLGPLNCLTILVLKFEQSTFVVLYIFYIAGCVVDSVAADQKPCFVASDMGPHCLLRPVCPNPIGLSVPTFGLLQ